MKPAGFCRSWASRLVVASAIALAAGGARAINKTWIGGTGGSEAAPLDIYDGGNWNPSGTPTTSDKLYFTNAVDAMTVLTNGYPDAATSSVSGDWHFKTGSYTFLGPCRFPTLENPANSGSTVIVKKGDWTITYAAYLCRGGNTFAFTNVSGKVTHTPNNHWFQLGNAEGWCVVENISGDWSLAGSFAVSHGHDCDVEFHWRSGNLTHAKSGDGTFLFAYNENCRAVVEKESGNWTTAGSMSLAHGKNATASFRNLGGNLKVNGSGICLCDNSGSTRGGASLEIAGGTVEAKRIWHGSGAAPATVAFNGGTFKAAADGTIVSNSAFLSVSVTSNGGTIDANGKSVTVEAAIEDAPGETGRMAFGGGGSVTLAVAPAWTGGTTVELGTMLVTPAAVAGERLAVSVPSGTAAGVYTVVSVSGMDEFSDGDCAAITTADPSAAFVLSGDRRRILCLYKIDPSAQFYIGPLDGDLCDDENWLSGRVPTSGNACIFCSSAATLSAGEDFRPGTITIPGNSAVVTIASGELHVSGSLTNASRLAIASGATLAVDGDLVAYDATSARFLYSNEGNVTVGGNVVCASASRDMTTRQYAVVTERTLPIRAGGLLYNRGSGRIYWRLESNDASGRGLWVVGPNGLKFNNPESRFSSRFYAQTAPVTLYSASDWTLANTGLGASTEGDLQVMSSSALAIDTSDFDSPDEAHTVTLEGRIKAEGNVTIMGCGTVLVATTEHNGLAETSVSDGKTLAVTDTATLAIRAGRKVVGAGTVSVAESAALRVAESGTATVETALALEDGATLGFRFTGNNFETNEGNLPRLALANGIEAAGAIQVDVSAEMKNRPKTGVYVLTEGAGLPAGTVVRFADGKPKWARDVRVNANGEIEIYVVMGFSISIR